MKVLHIDSSITGTASTSRAVTRQIVEGFKGAGAQITYRDLVVNPPTHLDEPHSSAADPALTDFLEADVVVIGAPMYNFSVPSQLKAWIDRILIAGKTFAYDEKGPRGLAGGKRVILAVTRGGFYEQGAALEHVESYLKATFAFIGITAEVIQVDGLMTAQRDASLEKARAAVASLALGA